MEPATSEYPCLLRYYLLKKNLQLTEKFAKKPYDTRYHMITDSHDTIRQILPAHTGVINKPRPGPNNAQFLKS